VSPAEQCQLDQLVVEALALAAAELRVIEEWAAQTRG
jgi:hypothetical protein